MRWKQQEGNTSAIFSYIMTKANLAHMTPQVLKWKVSPAHTPRYLKNLLILNKTVKYSMHQPRYGHYTNSTLKINYYKTILIPFWGIPLKTCVSNFCFCSIIFLNKIKNLCLFWAVTTLASCLLHTVLTQLNGKFTGKTDPTKRTPQLRLRYTQETSGMGVERSEDPNCRHLRGMCWATVSTCGLQPLWGHISAVHILILN